MAEEELKVAKEAGEYLMSTVAEPLSKALAACSGMEGEMAENLGKYLIKAQTLDEQAKAAEADHTKWLAEADHLEAEAKAEKDQKEAAQRAEEEKLTPAPFDLDEFKTSSINDCLAQLNLPIRERIDNVNVHWGMVHPHADPENEEANEKILYPCSTDKIVSDGVLVKGTGVCWDVLKDPEEEEEDPENPKPPKPREILHIPDMLVPGPYRERVHFFNRPMCGALLACPLRIKSVLNAEALVAPLRPGWPGPEPEEEEKPAEEENADAEAGDAAPAEDAEKEEEPEKEVIPDPPTVDQKWVLCLDTAGAVNDFAKFLPWIREKASQWEACIEKAAQQALLAHRAMGEKLNGEDCDVSKEIEEGALNKFSDFLLPGQETMDKYCAILTALGVKEDDYMLPVTATGAYAAPLPAKIPKWSRVKEQFAKTHNKFFVQKQPEVEDLEALKALVDELVESSPGAFSKVLKCVADLAQQKHEPTPPAEEAADAPADE